MKKIGILTFHRAHNYGAVLQAYALQENLKSCGFDVEIIDYKPDFLKHNFFYINKKNFFTIIKSFIYIGLVPFLYYKLLLRLYSFSRFVDENLVLSNEKYSDSNLQLNGYDYIIFGSDQIWNEHLTKGNRIYWGDFPKSGKSEFISYAASMETTSISDAQKERYCQYLKNFKSISVREKVLVELLQPLTKKTISWVLDPTLLVNRTVFEKIATPPKIKGEFILLYLTFEDEKAICLAESIASRLNAKVIVLNCSFKKIKRFINIPRTSPSQFVGYFKEALFVITTSFHGTTFSLIFNKPFFTIEISDKHSRVKSLLNCLGIENRLIDHPDVLNFSEIDYTEVNKRLNALKFFSQKYILDSIVAAK